MAFTFLFLCCFLKVIPTFSCHWCLILFIGLTDGDSTNHNHCYYSSVQPDTSLFSSSLLLHNLKLLATRLAVFEAFSASYVMRQGYSAVRLAPCSMQVLWQIALSFFAAVDMWLWTGHCLMLIQNNESILPSLQKCTLFTFFFLIPMHVLTLESHIVFLFYL